MQEHTLLHTTHKYIYIYIYILNKLTIRIIFGLAKKEKVRVHVQNKNVRLFLLDVMNQSPSQEYPFTLD